MGRRPCPSKAPWPPGAIALLALSQFALSPAAAQMPDYSSGAEAPAASGPLRIISFDLRSAPSLATETAAETQRPSWRTSFGSEVHSESKKSVPSLQLDADVVLLQGLTSVRVVRRLFPARQWKLVISRQLLSTEENLDAPPRDAKALVPTTAVAVRFQRDVRITGQDHLMELARRDFAGKAKPPAATAVRLSVRGRSFWVVSAGLTPECLADRAQCLGAGLLDRWRSARVGEGEATYTGGAIAVDIPKQPCSGQAIVGDIPEREASVAEPGPSEPDSIVGCLARYEIAR